MTVEASPFASEGFTPFPNLYEDNKHIGEATEWPDTRIEEMVTEYWLFLERDDIQARARGFARRVLNHLGFEMDARYGAYPIEKLEDEVCDGES